MAARVSRAAIFASVEEMKMATVKFKKKTPAGPPGNFKYEYECTCANGKKQAIEVQSANDNQAKQLAQLECDEKCEES
jgi:hypothetical protein